MGFFKVSDVPSRRVVQYARVSGSAESVVYVADESLLGEPVDDMPFIDKTGMSLSVAGMLYEVAYLPDVGDVYIAQQPKDVKLKDGAAKLSVVAKAGKPEYSYQWFKDGVEVVSIPRVSGELSVAQAGKYFVRVIDVDGVEAVSKEAVVS